MKKSNFRERGFTLVEMIFVLAIILTLVAIFLPLATSKLSESKTATTTSSIDAVSAALTSFFSDIDHFPACDSSDCDPFTNANNDLKFLAFGTGSGSLTGEYPVSTSGSGSDWALTTNDSSTGTAEIKNNAFNHLAQNNPNGDATTGDAGFDYKSSKWKGPYIAKIAIDPFGFAYIAHVGAMEKDGSKISSGKGWILSAGPDGVLDTAPSAAVLSNDDLGYIFFTK